MRAAWQLTLLLAFLAAVSALYLMREEGAPLPDETVAGAPTFDGNHVRVSPDGQSIAFLRGPRFGRDIWVAPRGNLGAARPLGIAGDEGPAGNQGVLSFEWAYNGSHLLFRRPFDVAMQVYVATAETGEVLALNTLEETSAGTYTLSPRRPDEALLRLGPTPGPAFDLYRANLLTGQLNRIEERGMVHEYYADQDFAVRAGSTHDPQGFTLYARREAGWEELLTVPRDPGDRAGTLFLKGGGERLYILDDPEGNHMGLSAIDLAGGGRTVLAAPEWGDVAAVLGDPATSEVIAYAVAAPNWSWHALDSRFATDLARLNDLPGGEPRVVSQSLDNRIWIVESGDGVFIFDRDRDTVTQITS